MSQGRANCIVRGALAVMLHACRVLGVAPLRMKRTRNGWRISVLRALNYYGVLAVFSLNTCNYSALVRDFTLEPEKAVFSASPISAVVEFVQISSLALVSTVVICTAMSRMKHCINCLNILEQVQCRIINFKEANTYKRQIVATISLNILMIMFLHIEVIYSGNIAIARGKDAIITWMYTSYFYMYYGSQFTVTQFVIIALSIQITLSAVNNMLEDLDSRLASGFSDTAAAKAVVERVTLCFGAVCDVLRAIDKSFSAVLMATLIFYFVGLIIFPYFYVLSLLGGTVGQGFSLAPLLYLLGHIVFLVILCEPGHKIEEELDRSRVLVSQLLRRISSPRDALALELDLLYKQIELNHIISSPMGVCKLNRAFAAMLIGTIIPIVVTLLQYHDLEHKKKEPV